jgi:hypothetical protein
MGLAPSWYVIPQNRPLAEMMYQTAVSTLGWSDPSVRVRRPPDMRFVTMGVVLAQELGDTVTAARLRERVEVWSEPRFFGSDDDEFGFWFKLGEEYPRGQMSAFLILGELVEQGSWWRLFNQPNLAKFQEPVVVGVDYPKIGLSRAFNGDDGVLHVTTYTATASHCGDKTAFRVENVPSSAQVQVRRDGAPYNLWKRVTSGVIEIETDIDTHDFQVFAGGASAQRVADDRAATPRAVTASAPPPPPDKAANAVRDAGLLLISGAGTCPCCV